METTKLRYAAIIAIASTLIFLMAWEAYWRTQSAYYRPVVEDDRYLWAQMRARLETAGPEDIVIVGASRTGFNFRTQVWEEITGYNPINLSIDGKPAGPIIEDIVYNTDFKGTLIFGIAPIMIFSEPDPERWIGAQQWVEHYHKQTYAQKFSYFLSKPLQNNFVFLTASELDFYNDLDLKSMLNWIPLHGRIGPSFSLYNFSYRDEERNLIMLDAMVDDPAYAQKITDVWSLFLPYLPEYEVIAESLPPVFTYYKDLLKAIEKRGGKVILVRHKSGGDWYTNVKRMMPREKVWDVFVEMVGSPAYHFEDYEFMSRPILPDWSHMNALDAPQYTRDLVNQMIQDGHLKRNSKANK